MRVLVGVVLAASAVWPATAGAQGPGATTRAAATTEPAAGEPAPTLRAEVYSPYERSAIDAALADEHGEIDPAPEGKVVEGIDIVTLDVIDPRDPAPTLTLFGNQYSSGKIVNSLHVTTKHYVVDREVLLHAGDRYKAVTIDESVRNLRALPQLSLVLALAVKGQRPGTVRVLVITKDVWSLRLAWDLEAVPAGIEDFILQPSETNFLGTHQLASLYFELDPATLSYGAGYHVPRLAGTRNVVDASAQVIFNRATGSPEGSTGQVLAFEPLFSARSPWAWDSQVSWNEGIARRFVNAQESYFDNTAAVYGPPVRGRPYVPPNNGVPWEFFERTYSAQESLTRSFGWDVKHDLSVGGSVNLNTFRTTPAQAGVDPLKLAAFVTLNVPRSNDRIGPFVEYHGYRTRFLRVLDFQTLGLQEDYRLGHEVYVRVYPLARALGSTLDLLGVYAGLNYTAPLFGDGLVRATVESLTEAQSTALSQAWVAGGGEIVTPRLGIGRLVYDVEVLNRYRNFLNQETFLGGDTRLRGYPSNFFVGSDMFESNLELRSRPVELLHTVELGASVFYDVGDAAFGFNKLHLYQGVGAGFRALFPQLDREVFRVDFGFPVGSGREIPGVAPWSFFIAFQQAFRMPALTSVALPSGAPADGNVPY